MTTPTDNEIRAKVQEAYGNRVRGVLESDLAVPMAGDSCCATSSSQDSCCGVALDEDVTITRIAEMYAQSNLTDLPATVTDVAFGCGNPTAISALKPGEVVLDLGSGGGIDCFLASKMVGETGRVFGVDMTPEMIALARRNAEKVGATNVEFRQGQIEALPIGDATVDVIISNCVINLSPDKDAVFREAFRVLKPGGRLQVSDVVWKQPVPENVKNDMEKWAGCIAGALVETDYLAKIAAAGFEQITSDATEYPGGQGIASAAVVAVRPN